MSRRFSGRTSIASIACLLALSGAVQAQLTWHVDDDAALGGDGLGWDTSFRYLQDALWVATVGDEIRVAGGIYKPDQDEAGLATPGERKSTFQLVNGVRLYGGYAGLADPNHPDQRNFELYRSTLSGDLAGNDSPGFGNYDENSHQVVTGSACDETAVLDGFTVSAGNANGPVPYDRGGGVYTSAGSPTLTSCTVTLNRAGGLWSLGAGICCMDDSSPAISDCTISDNRARTFFSMGGGLYCSFSNPRLTNCVIRGNSAQVGGGINLFVSDPTLIDCLIIDNRTIRYSGGGIDAFTSLAVFERCTIENNSATSGGGVSCQSGGPTFISCRIVGNSATGTGGGVRLVDNCTPWFINCLISGNSAVEGAGLVNGNPTVINCTITANTASGLGGGVSGVRSARFANCILWGNRDSEGDGESSQFRGHVPPATVNYCCIEGLDGSLGGVGNIAGPPRFADPDNADYRLAAGSPCIDATDNDAVLPEITTDLDGNPRLVDDPGMPDDGHGAPPIGDLGAYEFQDETCFVDLDGDGDIDLADLETLLSNYGATGTVYTDGDLDRDEDVDLSDLATLLGVYGTTCE